MTSTLIIPHFTAGSFTTIFISSVHENPGSHHLGDHQPFLLAGNKGLGHTQGFMQMAATGKGCAPP